MTKEKYKKTIVRMWDSLRDRNKGVTSCLSVACEECPLEKSCQAEVSKNIYNVHEYINIVEKWGKEHPIKTNADKFKEVFGLDAYDRDFRDDVHVEWLEMEYQEPKGAEQ